MNEAPTRFGHLDLIFSIAGSLVSAAIWYLIFLIADARDRYADSLDISAIKTDVSGLRSELRTQFGTASAALKKTFTSLDPDGVMSGGRFIFQQHPKEQVQLSIDASEPGRIMEVDALGLNLRAFVDDHLDCIVSRENARLRVVLPDPRLDALRLMCEREGRDHKRVVADIIYTTLKIVDLKPEFVRWHPDIATLTLVRVNSAVYWRPRLGNDDLLAEIFYHEANKQANKRLFDVLADDFTHTWKNAKAPSKTDVTELK